MNRQEGDILNALLAEPYTNQRRLSEYTGHSLGIVNRSLKNLKEEGYLDEQIWLTEKAGKKLKEKAPKNAIILADGFGVRTGLANTETPKGLLEVKGEPLIERTVKQLHEVGLQEIYVVVGFLKEQYEYLIDTYGVKLIVNPDYASKDTFYSLFFALPHLSNTYVIPCDVWCRQNPYHKHETYSWYMVGDAADGESTVRVNRKMELVSISGQTGGNKVVGIAYLLEEQAAVVRRRIMERCNGSRNGGLEVQGQHKEDRGPEGQERHKEYRGVEEQGHSKGLGEFGGRKRSGGHRGNERNAEKVWETVLYRNDRMIIPARVVHGMDAVRIRTLEQLRRLESVSGQRKADALAISSRFLGALPDDIVDLATLKKGMSNRTFLFSGKGRKYVLWMPAEEIGQLFNPSQEMQIYASVSGKGICDNPVYISPENGCRITRYVEGTRSCDPMYVGDIEKCMAFLRHFHGMGLTARQEVDLFGLIAFYEGLWDGKQSLYKDYTMTRENVLSLKSYIDSLDTKKSLTHLDIAPDKFLFIDRKESFGRRKEEELQLIGWEYAGMQDPHVDIAMFCIASLYDREWVDKLISTYFEGSCPDATRIKIYCYIAVCGLLRSNWCEYRMKQGEEFGEYSLRQYRYAKEYYRIAREEMTKIEGQ